MKTTKLMTYTMGVIIMLAFGLVGCEGDLDIYSIDAPSDLQARIDSIEAAKNAVDTGDTTFLTINTAIVGAEDNSSGWFSAFSDYFTIPIDQKLVLKFENYGSGVNNWNNWNLALSNVPDRDAENYAEIFVLRSDAFGWGNENFDLGVVSQNYPDLDGDGDIWNDFRQIMQGADVTLEVDFSVTGYVFVTATAIGADGTELVMTYNQPVIGAQEVSAFLIVDNSHFLMDDAYLLPSEISAVEDVEPASIAIANTPTTLEIGNENFWGNGVATVTFADGSTSEIDSAELSFNVVPDMTTVGQKTVIVAYNKTKQGEFTQAISSFYNLQVINAVTALEVTTMPDVTTYTFPGPVAPAFNATGMEVTATYSDNTTGIISNDNLHFEIPGADGVQDAIISYVGATSTVTTTVQVTNSMGATNQVGASDFSSPFFSALSNDYNVPSGSSRVFKMDLGSSGANNWNSPLVVLRKADLSEYAVLRMDNFGWGDGYGSATLTNDWNFDVFAANLNDSYIEVTVTNNGDGTADVRYDVTYANGDTHFQLYEGVTVDGSDLNCAITIDGCYVEITSVE